VKMTVLYTGQISGGGKRTNGLDYLTFSVRGRLERKKGIVIRKGYCGIVHGIIAELIKGVTNP